MFRREEKTKSGKSFFCEALTIASMLGMRVSNFFSESYIFFTGELTVSSPLELSMMKYEDNLMKLLLRIIMNFEVVKQIIGEPDLESG